MIRHLFKYLLMPFSILYGIIVWLRNRLYDSGFVSSVRFDIPLIAVGNLSVGGTGKTPHIEYLIRLLRYEYKLATMSRGYKRRTRGFILANAEANAVKIGDEPMQYFLKYPELAVSVAEDRMTGIPSLLMQRPETEVVLLDDAYQHRSVHPGLNMLITDFFSPFYEDHILPLGRLRENRSAYQRADIIIVSKCPRQLSREQADEMIRKIAPKPYQQVFFSAIRYATPYYFQDQASADFQGKQVVLIAGIAKPEPLVAHVQSRAKEVHLLSYPDHHLFSARNIEEIRAAVDNWKRDCVLLTTEKDATRLHLHKDALAEMGVPVVIQPIEVYFLFGQQEQFDAQVREFVVEQRQNYLHV